MSLGKLKELEDLKAEHQRLSEEYKALWFPDKERVLDELATEFRTFMQGEGFNVSSQGGGKFKATYGSTEVFLEVPPPDVSFWGALTALTLTCSSQPKIKWNLVVFGEKRSSKPRVSVRVRPNDEVERLKEDISDLKTQIQEFTPVEYTIMYYQDGSNRGAPNGPIVNSLSEAISAVLS